MGSATRSSRTYDEAIEQIQLADRLGFNTVWVVEHHFRDGRSASPCSEAILGGLALSTEQIKLGFGVTLMPFGFIHPARVAEKVATVDVLCQGRVEWGTGRSTPMEQVAFGVPTDDRSRDQWREAVEIVVKMWEPELFSWDSPEPHVPASDADPQAVPGSASAGVAGGRVREERGHRRRTRPGPAAPCLSSRWRRWRTPSRLTAAAQAIARPEDQLTRVKNDRVGVYTLVHCYDDEDEAAAYGLWDSVSWWYRNLAEFTLQWELAACSPRSEKAKALPAVSNR